MTPRFTALVPVVVAAALGCGSNVIGGNGGESGETTTTFTSPTTTTITDTTTSTTTTSTTTTSTTTTSSTTTTATFGALPPPPGPQNTPDGNGSVIFAISKLYVGDTDRDGTPNQSNGWKQYGFNLDGDFSTATSTNLCKPRKNAAPKNAYPDGDNGIDNAFGKSILPILLGLASNFSTQQNDWISSGQGTYLFDLVNLGMGADYGPLLSRIYVGGDLGAPPIWSGNDHWPIRPESLASPPDLATAKLQTGNGYLVGNTWVARMPGMFVVTLNADPFGLELPIMNPLLAMNLDASHQSATYGTIAGVIPTDALTASLKKVAGMFDPSLCVGPTIDSILSQVEQASDIMQDGSQDPTQTCDGITVGLGFDALRVQAGPLSPPQPPPPDPCGP